MWRSRQEQRATRYLVCCMGEVGSEKWEVGSGKWEVRSEK
jgi:hypothetical protein